MKATFRALAAIVATALGIALPALVAAPAYGEDIDIYVANAGSADLPNVLFVLDNSSNWSSNLPVAPCEYLNEGKPMGKRPPAGEQDKKVGLEKCALHNAVDALEVAADGSARVKVGLMLSNEPPASKSGGYPRIAFTPLNKANKDEFKERIRALEEVADKSSNAAFAKTLHEAFLYFNGQPPAVGSQGSKFDPAAFLAGRYVSPSAASCGRNYIIFIGNGSPGETNDNQAEALLASIGGSTKKIEYPTGYVGVNEQKNWADEYTRFMSGVDVSAKDGIQAITTYTIAVTGAKSDNLYPNFLRGMAQYGGGKFYEASNAHSLTIALLEIFQEVAAVDSTFVSASLPVSVNSRGTYLNQIFMGVFRPDANAAPRWRGNLKQFRFNYDQVTDSLMLADSTGASAISSGTGFFAPNAVSYWTEGSEFWLNEPMGTPKTASDSPDGEVVEKGGAAQRLRTKFAESVTDRKVYTCVACASSTVLGSSSATRFETGNSSLTALKLGAAEAERAALIDWVRGLDNVGDEKKPGGTTVVRPSMHGDVLHSRPVVVNYGGSRGVVVFYGANDGMLHAVNGNQAGSGAGEPYWSFVPEEGFPKLKRLRGNSPTIRFSTTPASLTTPEARDYFVDGPLSVYQKVAGGVSEKVYLYVALRRGGRALYAFDVTDPVAPRLMWKKTDAHIPVLGQTWSEPRVARVKGHANPVLVMGAGYDPAAEDVEPRGPVTMGNAVLVLDAVTGELLAKFDTNRPVAADVSLVDSDYDGYVDRGYFGDLGGTVYRIDFESASASGKASWAATRFAELGSSGYRKIFFSPEVVLTRDFAVIMLGTGDREKPLKNATNERFFMLIDDETAKGVSARFTTITDSQLVSQTAFTSPATQRGCYIPMDPGGEKVVNSPVSAGGMTYFSTNRPTRPTGNSCTGNLGEAKVYAVPLVCQKPESQVLAGGGLPPSPVTGTVAITTGTGPDGSAVVKHVPFIIGGINTRKSGIEAAKVVISVSPRRSRLYWFNEADR